MGKHRWDKTGIVGQWIVGVIGGIFQIVKGLSKTESLTHLYYNAEE